MATPTPFKGFPTLDPGQAQPNIPLNAGLEMIDLLMGGISGINLAAAGSAYTLTGGDLENGVLNFYGATANVVATINKSGWWGVINGSAFSVTLEGPSTTFVAVIPANSQGIFFSNGSNAFLMAKIAP